MESRASLKLKAWWAFIAIIFLIGLLGTANDLQDSHRSTRTFTPTQLKAFVTEQAECHAEFFYTNDPTITGVGIDQAVAACLPK
jgi:hypothetical protein